MLEIRGAPRSSVGRDIGGIPRSRMCSPLRADAAPGIRGTPSGGTSGERASFGPLAHLPVRGSGVAVVGLAAPAHRPRPLYVRRAARWLGWGGRSVPIPEARWLRLLLPSPLQTTEGGPDVVVERLRSGLISSIRPCIRPHPSHRGEKGEGAVTHRRHRKKEGLVLTYLSERVCSNARGSLWRARSRSL